MIQSDARQRLIEFGWLSLMPDDFRTTLLDLCVWKKFSAGQAIYAAGDQSGGMYGIADGAIEYTAALGRADTPPAHVGQAVVWTGLGPLLTGQPRRASIMAIEAVTAAYAPLAALEAMLGQYPAWWKHIAQELLIEFDVVTNATNDLMIRSARRRCAATLLRVANSRFTDTVGPNHRIPVSHDSLATMTNLSRSTVGAVLRDLVDKGHIELGYRYIVLRDVGAIRASAEGD